MGEEEGDEGYSDDEFESYSSDFESESEPGSESASDSDASDVAPGDPPGASAAAGLGAAAGAGSAAADPIEARAAPADHAGAAAGAGSAAAAPLEARAAAEDAAGASAAADAGPAAGASSAAAAPIEERAAPRDGARASSAGVGAAAAPIEAPAAPGDAAIASVAADGGPAAGASAAVDSIEEASKEGASAAVDLSTTTTGTPGDLTATGSSALLSPEGPPAAARGAQRLGPAAEAYMEEQRRRGRRLGHAREGPSEPSSAGDPRAALDEERERFLAHLSALDAGPRWTWALEEGRGPSRPRPPPPPEQRGGSPGGCSAEPPGAPGAPPPTALDEERQRALDEDMAALEAVLQNLNSSRCSEPAGDARASTAPLRAAPARLPDSTVGAGEPQQDAPPSPQASVLGGGAPLICGALSTAERLLADLRAASRGRPPPHERRPPSGQRRAKRPGGEAAEQAPCLSDYLSLEARGSCSSLPAAAPERPSLSRSASSSLQGGQRKRAARGLDPLMFGSAAGLPRGLRAAAAPAGGALAGCLSLYQEVCERVYDSLQHHPALVAGRAPDPASSSAAAAPPRRKADPYLQDLAAWCRAAPGPAAGGGEGTGGAGRGAAAELCRRRRRRSGPLAFDPSTAACGDFLGPRAERALCEHYGVEAPRRRLDPPAPRRRR